MTDDPFAANLAVAYDRLFFPADSGSRGIELFSSDGTPAGTTLVRDIYPGAGSGLLALTARVYPCGAGRRVHFAADNGVNGVEPWRSSTAGTTMMVDLMRGPLSSSPGEFFTQPLRGRVYFGALGRNGREVYTWAPTIDFAVRESYGVGCPGTGGLTPVLSCTLPLASGMTVFVSSARALSPGVLYMCSRSTYKADAAGCHILADNTSSAVAIPFTTGITGAASISITKPPAGFYLQAVIVDPAVPVRARTVSNGLYCRRPQ